MSDTAIDQYRPPLNRQKPLILTPIVRLYSIFVWIKGQMTRSGNCEAAAPRHRHCCLKRFETKPREAEEHEALSLPLAEQSCTVLDSSEEENRDAVASLQQDSLGVRTKTCIIATVSPCQSSQEETVSTLDYAFRAKNIHNRPQINAAVPKDPLLSELATEIENLKRELIATRHRNGIYMTPDAHEEMVKEKESRWIINKEQKERIEVLESVVQHKAEELLALTRQLQNFESDNKEAHSEINRMNEALNKAYDTWKGSVTEVSDVTEKVESRMKSFQSSPEQTNGTSRARR
ncbi:hypothetical protein PENFLA_c030G03339 [Penicillium flavigenum]|uniref:Kinesin motor domain-containing protein n=1 Tax=Penicillium flavigenum TaxID=254877 RepID=A0A1V6SNZ4_9EURO|nr:hypothetical protein PENFLA_c030G03339 [Penicillium flavigenum]